MELLEKNIFRIEPPSEFELHHMDWATLRLLNAFRAFLLVAFAVAVVLPNTTVVIGKDNPGVFQIALLGYLILTGLYSFTISKKKPHLAAQFYLQSYVDIIVLCALMYSSGGVQSGLSILLIILIAIISHCSSSRYAVLFAAMSSIMILTQEIFVARSSGIEAAGFSQAAVSGITLFAAGYLISVVLPVRQKEVFRIQHQELQSLASSNFMMTSDLRLAAEVQAKLLPKPERFGEADVTGFCTPAHYVGGDAYDYFLMDDDNLVLYMADVVGHGAASAMVSYAVHNQLNPRVDGMCMRIFHEVDGAEEFIQATMKELNASFAHSRTTDHYFTLLFAVLHLPTGRLTFCQAGHPFPILHRASTDQAEEVGDAGMPVGMFEEAEFEVYTCQLEAGDCFYIFSDGALECFSPEQEQFGVDRLVNNLRDSVDFELAEFKNHLLDNLIAWQRKDDFDDDVSMLRIQYNRRRG